MSVGRCVGPVGGDELDEVRMQQDVAIVVEFADRDPQPLRVHNQRDCVGPEIAEFPDSHPGAGQQFDR